MATSTQKGESLDIKSMARHVAPSPVHLADYAPPAYLVERIDLRVKLFEDLTRVVARMLIRRNPAHTDRRLVLNGRALELVRILKDGRRLNPGDYQLDEESLCMDEPGEQFELEIETIIHPEKNTQLEGLYKSGKNFCTQCEAEGFRRIMFYPDRPDVLARFSTYIEADRRAYPVLLSNGNPVESGELENGRHFALWEDPFPKPSYLFALVAGQLCGVESEFITCSGRRVKLRVYVEEHNLDKCDHALKSLQEAMRWDEERYGREYDLDIYMIVAVDDFNMGAMENKGLNIFNSKYVLARPDTASDADFRDIQSVVAHEYFHNWTGNRITCRDWFQLTLKEGLTVFRDQEFSAEHNSPALKRIEDVRFLRNRQFSEDAGPMAHPVQPRSYMEINNFYTATVYNKGAEIIRMIRTLLGERGFHRGMDLYFASHDGEAATTEDFLRAMEDATGVQLKQFRRWYQQAGTPRLCVSSRFDENENCLHLKFHQRQPATLQNDDWEPLHIPVRLGLLDDDGAALPLRLESEREAENGSRVLELRDEQQTFRFAGIERRPVLSVLRGFSAPVSLEFEQTQEDLAFLMAHDSDPFNRWDAGQRLATGTILARLNGDDEIYESGQSLLSRALRLLLGDEALDPALAAQALELPPETELAGRCLDIDVEGIHRARAELMTSLTGQLADSMREACGRHAAWAAEDRSPGATGGRSLYNVCQAYLVLAGDPESTAQALSRVRHGRNMSTQLGALRALVHADAAESQDALDAFEKRWCKEPLVMDSWLTVQATVPVKGAAERVGRLLLHQEFNFCNPNRIRALLGAFGESNPYGFHAADGGGYRLISEQVMRLDPINPSMAARLVAALTRWHRYDEGRRALMRAELERIAALDNLSRNVYELVSTSLEKPVLRRQA